MKLQLQVQKKPAAAPLSTLMRANLLQRKCACGGSPGIDGECSECRSNRLALHRRSWNQSEPWIAPTVDDLSGSEVQPLDSNAHAFKQPSLGHDFSRIRVDVDRPPVIQPRLAISQQGDRYEQEADRAAGQVICNKRTDAAREASDVVGLSRTKPLIQRSIFKKFEEASLTSKDTGGETASSPAKQEAEAVSEPNGQSAGPSTSGATSVTGLIVEDDAEDIGPGQMRKSDFLDQLRTAVSPIVPEAFADTVNDRVDFYSKQSSQRLENDIHTYAPNTVDATSASDYISAILELVRQAVSTGENDGGLGSTIISAAASFMGNIFFKGREGGAEASANPQAVQTQLGSGSPLDSGVKAQMESAFGRDFSHVRVHTDAKAAGLSAGLNARAFTIGQNVAFGAREYQPGTMIGDALIAHELAHVVQQSSSKEAVAPLQVGDAGYNSLEEDADISAVGAVASIWGGAKGTLQDIARKAMPRLRSGLRLSMARCGKSADPKKTVTVNVTYLKDGSTDLASHLTKANSVYKQANVEVTSGKSETLDETKSKAILGADLILDEFSDPSSPTTEEQALLKENRTAGKITMYYVKELSLGSIGEAFPPYSGQPVSFVFASYTSRTWPHELGHVLLDSGDHPSDADNFMAQTSVATGKELMTDEQIKKVRSSPFVS